MFNKITQSTFVRIVAATTVLLSVGAAAPAAAAFGAADADTTAALSGPAEPVADLEVQCVEAGSTDDNRLALADDSVFLGTFEGIDGENACYGTDGLSS
jgi:hypothetical protein